MSQKTVDILRECIPTFTVLSDENRLMILHILFENGSLNVNDLTERLHLSRPAVSHHLKIMLDAGLVRVDQQGKERYYTVSLQQAGERFRRLMSSFIADGCIKPLDD
ncbi:putative ArsR-family transcriptional regulator [Actinobacillus minor 202]|uniref:ArsR family transcriptional regulator n=3 Tax=Pasteurellaceae TaxID=712 RepID=A0ABY6TNT2_9PAST|nr:MULTISPECIES: metalloregulator ArsR/SmtB family transcription factor [Actinobacillus]EEV25164.1 putative ArsR-family transcriptional regulator [Actinobacillus minor 202]VFY94020.1 ArsR family transcriptional regulator [Actinobacillus porcinus]VTU09622.1 ArsR family transcriptional regulator [Actinobacillus porcinus]